MKKTAENFFQNSRVSFMDIGEELPRNLVKIPVPEPNTDYYTDLKQSLIIRESKNWGLVGQCFWLLAGEVPDSTKKRIGLAYLNDFQQFKPGNGWIRLKDIYDLLPDGQLEIVHVRKEESEIIIGETSYKCQQAASKYGFCHSHIGWTVYRGDQCAKLPATINVMERDGSLKIKGFNVPRVLNRDEIIFTVLLDEIIPDRLSKEKETETLNNTRNFRPENFGGLLKKYGIAFMSKNDYFMFKVNDEIIKIKIKEASQEKTIISCIQEISFN